MSAVQSWIRENAYIASAIALPVMVATLFGLATTLPRLYVDDPQFDLLLVADSSYNDQTAFDVMYHVEGAKLQSTASYFDGNPIHQTRVLHRYHARTGELEQLEMNIPAEARKAIMEQADGEKQLTQSIELSADLENLVMLSGAVAPDGYTFRNQYGRSGGLFGELFGLHNRRYSVTVERDGRVIAIPIPHHDGYRYYRDIQFLGWIEQ